MERANGGEQLDLEEFDEPVYGGFRDISTQGKWSATNSVPNSASHSKPTSKPAPNKATSSKATSSKTISGKTTSGKTTSGKTKPKSDGKPVSSTPEKLGTSDKLLSSLVITPKKFDEPMTKKQRTKKNKAEVVIEDSSDIDDSPTRKRNRFIDDEAAEGN